MLSRIIRPSIISRPPLNTALPVPEKPHWRVILAQTGWDARVNELEFASSPGGANLCSGGTGRRWLNIYTNYYENNGTPFNGNTDDSVLTGGLYITHSLVAYSYSFATPVAIREVRAICGPSGTPTDLPNCLILQCSDNLTSGWETVNVASDVSAWTTSKTKVFSFPGMIPASSGRSAARAWRMHGTTINGGSSGLNVMAEHYAFAFAKTVGGANAAIGAHPYGGRVGNGGYFNLLDGNNTTHGLVGRADDNDGFNLGCIFDEPTDMAQFRLTPRNGTVKDFTVQYSNDLWTWTTVLTVTGNTTGTDGVEQSWTF